MMPLLFSSDKLIHSIRPHPHQPSTHTHNTMAAADSWEYPAQRKFDDVAPLAEVDPNDKAGKRA